MRPHTHCSLCRRSYNLCIVTRSEHYNPLIHGKIVKDFNYRIATGVDIISVTTRLRHLLCV